MRCSVVSGVTWRLLVIHISSSSPAMNTAPYYRVSQLAVLGTVAVVQRRPCWQHLPVAPLTEGTKATYRLRIAISAYSTWHLYSTPPLVVFPSEYRHPVWYGKTRMVWLADGEKIRRYVYSFWHNPRTWQTQTHRQTHTARRHMPRLCIASRGKNDVTISGSSNPKQEVKVIWQKAPHGGPFPG